MKNRQTPPLLLLICTLLLAGCGQTGPLYLPESEQAPEQTPEQAAEQAPEQAPEQQQSQEPGT
jgi:predicted small lipoprotein YifL